MTAHGKEPQVPEAEQKVVHLMTRRREPELVVSFPDPDDLTRLEMALEPLPNVDAIGCNTEEPSKPVSITFLVPAALSERLNRLTWELRCTTSELLRGILWQRLDELQWEFHTVVEAPQAVPAQRKGNG